LLKTSDFDYDLPPEFIAQTPVEPRDASRLLVLDRKSGKVNHVHFYQLGEYLHAPDVLVINETRVIPARLYARKVPTGGRVELLLLRRKDERTWEAIVGGKGGPRRLIRFEEELDAYLQESGHVPLPPYIHEPLNDPERYQTVYARQPGSAAAPTAGLHFTPRLIAELKERGIRFVHLTLHVGLDTFAPVTEETPQGHKIHTEWCQLDSQAAAAINLAKREGGRIVAVGTTSVRTLESAALLANKPHIVAPFEGSTDLFILPGFQFKAVDVMVTNFHLPRSTLIMLVSAFAGREQTLNAYEIAKQEGYRFYSFGDAMLIL
jgi:S-adenosylmethionine:tRNA ribosyltransferase-isomerase